MNWDLFMILVTILISINTLFFCVYKVAQIIIVYKEKKYNKTIVDYIDNLYNEINKKPPTVENNKRVAKDGGKFVKSAKEQYEQHLGQPVVTALNASDKELLEIAKDKEKK